MIWRLPSTLVTQPTFYVSTSSSKYTDFLQFQLGLPGDIPVAADYDNDGKTDIAVYRGGFTNAWYILLLSQNYTATATYQWGLNDTPVPGDYDGDGRLDIATYNAGEARGTSCKAARISARRSA